MKKLLLSIAMVAGLRVSAIPECDTVYIDTLDLHFESFNTAYSAPLETGSEYLLIAMGTAGIDWDIPTLDAAFEFLWYDSVGWPITAPPTPEMHWSWDTIASNGNYNASFIQNIRPTPDIYNPDHVYYYHFIARDTTTFVHFQDKFPSGPDGTNCGSLRFYLAQLENCNTLGIEETKTNKLIYPNPATDYIQIPDNLKNYSIVDLYGSFISVDSLEGSKINISSLRPGMYFLISEDNTFSFVKI